MVGRHDTIKLSFMLVGHTKFSPDWCFGLLKQKLRRTEVHCLDDIVQAVNSSAVVNKVHLVRAQDGETLVPTYNWVEFLNPHFYEVKGIIKYHHFQFSIPGNVIVKEYANSAELEVVMLKRNSPWAQTISASQLPPIIPPAGLSKEYQLYLYNKIREFCREEVRDLVCPRPSFLPPLPSQSPSSPSSSPSPPPPKKSRRASYKRKNA